MTTNHALDNYLNTDSWRALWKNRTRDSKHFGVFIAEQFCMQMTQIGYIFESLDDLLLVKNPDKNQPLYHLAYFSRHPLGLKFWRKAKQQAEAQLGLF